MGADPADPGTVVRVMADLPEPAADGHTDPVEPDETTEQTRPDPRRLDRRTIAICACIAVVAALLAGLVASLVLDEDTPTDRMELEESGEVDVQAFLDQPLVTVDGDETDLRHHQDAKPMLVNLWASNCPPCVFEMPLLNDAQKANPDITFVGVATQDDLKKAVALAEQTDIAYPWVLDPTGELYLESKGAGMPTTLLLAADGSVVDSKSGAFDNPSELQAFLDQAG